MPMDFRGWAQVRSFNCDVYWPLLNMYWESSGFGLGFNNGGGWPSINAEGDYVYIYRHTEDPIYIYIYIGSLVVGNMGTISGCLEQ